MDMANFAAVRLGRMAMRHFERMHLVLRKNFSIFADVKIPLNDFLTAISRDKKNTATILTLILPNEAAQVEQVGVPADAAFQSVCRDYFNEIMHD
jgi:3-dehydroquinate synthetase